MSADVASLQAPSEQGLLPYLSRRLPALYLAVSRAAAVALQFVLQLVVGNLAGPAGLGLLQLFHSWTCVLGEVLAQGLPAQTLRVTSVAWGSRNIAQCAFYLRQAVGRILKGCIILTAIVAVSLPLLHLLGSADTPWVPGLVILAVLVASPLFALLRLGSETLKAVDMPLQAITLESLLAPAVMLAVCLGCWAAGMPLLPAVLLVAGISGFIVVLLATARALKRRLASVPGASASGAAASRANRPSPYACGNASELRALWLNSLLSILFLQFPFLLLPWFAGTEEIGVFAVSYKLISVITTLLMLMTAVFGPAFARAAEHGDKGRLATLLVRTQCVSLAIFLPIAVAINLGAGQLGGIFNLGEGSLGPFLLALTAGQLINAATGLSGVLLNMAGAARRELWTLVLALAFAGGLAPFVGHLYGALGIAWLFSATLIVKNLASYFMAVGFLKHMEHTR